MSCLCVEQSCPNQLLSCCFQYLIANLGMSTNFGFVDLDHLTFPATMKVDYIRVYQDPDNINIGCDPDDFPTAAYINEYVDSAFVSR